MTIKPGFFTSEFYATIVGIVANLILALNLLNPDQANQIADIVAQIVGMFTTSLLIWGYQYSRAKIKTQAEDIKKTPPPLNIDTIKKELAHTLTTPPPMFPYATPEKK